MAKSKTGEEMAEVGKRKAAIARVVLARGTGKITVNGREFLNYFGREALRYIVLQPFEVTKTTGQYDVAVNMFGGGPSAQADALKHGISKALRGLNPDFKKPLRDAGLLTRDARIVERKKYGRRGARKRPQYSKR